MRFLLLFLLLFASCTFQSKMKRAEQKLDRAVVLVGPHASIGYIAAKYGGIDTTTIVKYDTAHHYLHEKFIVKSDTTIRLERDNVRVQFVKIRDTIKIGVECVDSLIYVERIASLEKAIKAYEQTKKYESELQKVYERQNTLRYLILMVIVLLILLIIKAFIR